MVATTDKPRRFRSSLWRGLLPRRTQPDWEPTRLPRGMTPEDAEAILNEYHTCKAQADPWIKRYEAARVLMDDIPSGVYGLFRLRRHKPRNILDQGAARQIIRNLGQKVPETRSKAPIKVDKI